MFIRGSLAALAFSALGMFVYTRYGLISLFFLNTPDRLPSVQSFGHYEIKFANQIRSCEDFLMLEEHGLALAACDPGRERWNTVMGMFLPGDVTSARLYVYDYLHSELPDRKALRPLKIENFPGQNDFHTLGMAYDEKSSRLYVVNHAKAGSRLEIFHVDLAKLTAKHIQTLQHPLIYAPNAISIINDNEFYLTNDHYIARKDSTVLAVAETFLSPALAPIVRVKVVGSDVQAKVVGRVPFANGIAILNKTTVAVSATSRGSVWLMDVQDDQTLKLSSQIGLRFMPDNLSSHGGKLYIAGHPYFPTLASFTKSRYICNDPDELDKATAKQIEACTTATAGSWVSEWSEKDGVKDIYVGSEYPTSCTAAFDAKHGVGIISGLYAKGIMIWKE